MYGVKILRHIKIPKRKHQLAFGLFSPWTLEPSQSKSVVQNKIMIKAVPLPEIKRKLEESTVMMLAMMAVLFLNQRLSKRIIKIQVIAPMITLGSIMVYGETPRILKIPFWSK